MLSRDLHSEFIALGLGEFARPAFKPLATAIIISYVSDEVAAIAFLATVNSLVKVVKDGVQRIRVRHCRSVALSCEL